MEGNKELVRRLVQEAVRDRDLEALDEIAAVPFVEVANRSVAPFRGAFPDFEMELVELISEGEKVVAHSRCSGDHLGEWLGVPPSAGSRTSTRSTSSRVRQGRLVSPLGVEDNLSRLCHLAIFPRSE